MCIGRHIINEEVFRIFRILLDFVENILYNSMKKPAEVKFDFTV